MSRIPAGTFVQARTRAHARSLYPVRYRVRVRVVRVDYNRLTSSPGSLLPPEIHSFPVGGGSLGHAWGRG